MISKERLDIIPPPKISIIIPAYCHQQFVGTAIASVLAQTFTDFELIIIDDASCDNTWDVIQSFQDPRITALRHETNLGAVQTINEGLHLARSRYLTILNSDDVFHPERLQRLFDVSNQEQAEFIITDVELVDGLGHVIQDPSHGWLVWFEQLKATYRQSRDIFLVLLSGNITVSTSNMFFSADVLKRIGYFNEYRYAHDYEFILRYMVDRKAKLHFLDGEKLLSYRLHGSNTITEPGLAVAQEVFGILSRWLRDLAPALDRQQLSALATQLIMHETEIEATLLQSRHKYAAEAQALRNSRSFKLGQALFVPVRSVLRWFG